MNTDLVNLQLPANLYEKIQTLADEKHTDPLNIITQLVTKTYQRRHWLQDLNVLRQQIQDESSSELGNTKEEIIAQLRQTRQEIFETDTKSVMSSPPNPPTLGGTGEFLKVPQNWGASPVLAVPVEEELAWI